MKQSPSWDAKRPTAIRVLPNIFCNPQFHYRTHSRPLSIAILSHISSAHASSSSNVLKFHLILFSHLRLGLPSCLFPWGLPPRTQYAPLKSPIRATCPAHIIFLTSSHEQYLVISTDHQAPRYLVFLLSHVTSPLLDSHLSLNILFWKILSPGICL